MNAVDFRLALAEVWRGQRPADLFVRGATVINVYSGELLPGNVAILGDRIAYVGPSEGAIGPDTQVIEAAGRFLCPGFIEPHAHPFSLYNPLSLAAGAVPRGNTTSVCDDLNPFPLYGVAGMRRLVDALRDSPMRYRWLARVSPNTRFPGEEQVFSQQTTEEMLSWPEFWGTAEVNHWFLWHGGNRHITAGVLAAKARGKRSDGHTAGASPERLGALVAQGMSADHEAITAEETLERLRLGAWVMLRHSSLRPDLPELAPLLARPGVDLSRICLTTDGPGPTFVDRVGYIDGAVRLLVELGVPAMTAIRCATINPATYFHMDEELGGIAPGRIADLQLLPDLTGFRPDLVITAGQVVAEHGRLTAPLPPVDWAALDASGGYPSPAFLGNPDLYRIPAALSAVTLPAMDFFLAAISRRRDVTVPVTDGRVDISRDPNLHVATVIRRDGRQLARALLLGAFTGLPGLATTYQNSGNIAVYGRNPDDMALAARRMAELGGGTVIADGGRIVFELPQTICGMASALPWDQVLAAHAELERLAAGYGYRHIDVLYSLDFITSAFLPGPKLTANGLIDVKTGAVLVPPVQL